MNVDCNVPLMKNKAGDKICCGCDRNYSVKKPPLHKKETENSRARERSNSLSKERPKSRTYGETIEKKIKISQETRRRRAEPSPQSHWPQSNVVFGRKIRQSNRR